MDNIAYSIPAELPKDIMEGECLMKPTESQIQKIQNFNQSQAIPSWSLSAENYKQKNNRDSTLVALPQGAYYGN